ncbi:Hint domain-containing protein [Paracoccus sp. YLB-12]|uniref:Hint domain-containing protein n=1 Tax=Paracoccus maritimus TaxID=2933292 RepID=A0ABT2K9H2_9RHOB|nr:Hint domain-containing protein [Paracoccus sp. YLB-12]MCT4333172.1 Hint domain-containing protein [Paracoccus sp. YLB-12]
MPLIKTWIIDTTVPNVTTIANDAQAVTAAQSLGSAASSTYTIADVFTGPPGTSGLDVLLEQNFNSAFLGNGTDDTISLDGGATQLTVQQFIGLSGVTITIDGGSPVPISQLFVYILSDGTVMSVPSDTFIAAQDLDGTESVVFDFSGAMDSTPTSNDVGSNLNNFGTVPCFVSGTLIRTENGEVPVENLRPGDRIVTRDYGLQPIVWIGSAHISSAQLQSAPHLMPIRIRAGALGDDLPVSDLLVSPQHRIAISDRIADRMFGESEVLVAAKHLSAFDGVEIAEEVESVTYWHILFNEHQIVISNGADTESLFLGPEAVKSMPAEAIREIREIFPGLFDLDSPDVMKPARSLVPGSRARRLVTRIAAKSDRHRKALSKSALV